MPRPAGRPSTWRWDTSVLRAETNTLGLRRGIKVSSLLSDPEWHVDAQDQVVVPVTDQVVFSVVVPTWAASPPRPRR